MRIRAVAVAVVAVGVMAAGGCMNQPDEKDAAASVRSSRGDVVAALRKAAAVLARDGEVDGGKGGYVSCGSSPTDAMEYRAGARLSGSGDQADRVRTAARALESAGWRLTSHSYSADPRPYARLSRDGLETSIDVDALRGSERLVFGVVGDCIRVAKGQSGDLAQNETIDLQQ